MSGPLRVSGTGCGSGAFRGAAQGQACSARRPDRWQCAAESRRSALPSQQTGAGSQQPLWGHASAPPTATPALGSPVRASTKISHSRITIAISLPREGRNRPGQPLFPASHHGPATPPADRAGMLSSRCCRRLSGHSSPSERQSHGWALPRPGAAHGQRLEDPPCPISSSPSPSGARPSSK